MLTQIKVRCGDATSLVKFAAMAPPSEALTEEVLSNRRRVLALRFGALALVAFGVGDAAIHGLTLEPLAVRLGWAACAVAIAQGLTATQERGRSWLLAALAFVSPLFYAALLQFRGGTGGVAFASFLATPVFFAVLFRGELGVAVAVSVSNLAAGLALLAVDGTDGETLADWGIALVSAGAIAIYAAHLHRAMRASEQAMNQDRLDALDRAARSDAQRARAEQVALLGQLAAGLAHEVNNPLAIITSNAELMTQVLRGPGRPDELRRLAQEMESGALRIAGVIRQLDVFAPSAQAAATCDLVAVVRSALAGPLPRQLTVHDALPEQLPQVRASADQLRRIVTQLLLTACSDLDRPPARQTAGVWLRASAAGREVVLVVEDDGPELWSGSGRGTGATPGLDGQRGSSSGLGLALARESMRQWGGSLAVEPRAGGGVRSTLRFEREVVAAPAPA